MKTFTKLSCLLMIYIAISSCASSTKQVITVFGTPGTEILDHKYNKFGSIQSNGQLQFKIRLNNDYYPYLLSHTPGTEKYVPFALDYKHKKYIHYDGFNGALWGSIIGIPIALATLPITANDNNITDYHDAKYLKTQRTNDEFVFTAYENTGERRAVGTYASIGTASSGTMSTASVQEGVSTARPRTQKAARTLRDYGKAVAGTYRGTGKLRQGETTVESYGNMTVTIERTDKSSVAVSVTDDYGEPFFNNKATYGVKKGRGRSYRLTLNGIPSATISVGGNGKLAYIHPKVNIDGEIYTLEISATKR